MQLTGEKRISYGVPNDNRYWLEQCCWSYRYHSRRGDSTEGRGRQPRQTLLWCPYPGYIQAIDPTIPARTNFLSYSRARVRNQLGPPPPPPPSCRYGDLLRESIYNFPYVAVLREESRNNRPSCRDCKCRGKRLKVGRLVVLLLPATSLLIRRSKTEKIDILPAGEEYERRSRD